MASVHIREDDPKKAFESFQETIMHNPNVVKVYMAAFSFRLRVCSLLMISIT